MLRAGAHRLVVLMVLLALLGWSVSASAQSREFDISQFSPPVDNYGLITLDTSQIYHTYRLGTALSFSYYHHPLEMDVLAADGSRDSVALVSDRLKMDLDFAIALCPYYEIGFDLPFLLYDDSISLITGVGSTGAAVGDIRIHNKIRALDREEWPVGLGVIATVVAPSGDTTRYFGNDGVGAEFKLVLDAELGPVVLATNLGYRLRPSLDVFVIRDPAGDVAFTQTIDDELLFGLGVQVNTPVDGLSVLSEIRGVTQAENPFDQRFNTPVMAAAAVKYLLPLGFLIQAGIEVGISPGYGVPPASGFMTIGYTWDQKDQDRDGLPDEDDQCPEAVEDEDGFEDEDGCPDPDNDQDGVLDVADECPDDPEDVDDYREEDGCPDPDNDQDGILDGEDQCPLAAEDMDEDRDQDGCPDLDTDRDGFDDLDDKCPTEPEDKDGFEDEDGCPEPDNDQDGVLDASDRCPLDPEDRDNFKDEDGCPDPDNDRDGVLDSLDNCPTTPETINGNADADGCPDAGEVLVIDRGNRLELKQDVKFEAKAALLKRSSFSLLNQVAQTIRARGDRSRVLIEVHTAAQGRSVEEKDLARSRGRMIRTYLENRGIDKERLEIRAIGGSQPIASNKTKVGREKNERIEFKLLPEPQNKGSVSKPGK